MDPVLFTLVHAVGLATLVVLEFRSPVLRRVLRDRRRMKRNVLFLAANGSAAIVLQQSVPWVQTLVGHGGNGLPLWVQIPSVFLIGELINWVAHWSKHQVPFLWRLHCQHHKEDQYTIWLITHTYAPEVIFTGTVISVSVLGSGFSPLALEIYLLAYSLCNAYQHSAHPYSLAWLDRWIINPAYHRRHHGGEQLNYGSMLTIWDRLFGTAVWPVNRFERAEPPSIDETPEPFDFFEEMAYPFRPRQWKASAPPERVVFSASAQPKDKAASKHLGCAT